MRRTDTAPSADGRQDGAGHGLPLICQAALRRTAPCYPTSVAEKEAWKAQRASVQRLLTAKLDRLLFPLGYRRDGGAWHKASAFARSELQFQKGQHGFECFFNAGVGPRWLARPLRLHRLARFCPEMGNDAVDAIPYGRLHDDPDFRAAILAVLQARMIPWMEAGHGLRGLAFRTAPEDMRATGIFEDA
jgi:hypothetical protein